MNKSALVRLFGFPATLIHSSPLVLDRWRWLSQRLPRTRNNERLLDIGCGSGAFSIGASQRGYTCLGLSWDERNQNVAWERARLCGAKTASFEIFDVRELDKIGEYKNSFDIVVCMENIEHILNDQKLFHDIAMCLRPGGRLLLSTPNLRYRSIVRAHRGPFSTVEDGGHVRRGYNRQMLIELARDAGLLVEEISYCSGFASQKLAALMVWLQRIHPLFAWGVILPLRLIPPLIDRPLSKLLRYPNYSICLEAVKPRYPQSG